MRYLLRRPVRRALARGLCVPAPTIFRLLMCGA